MDLGNLIQSLALESLVANLPKLPERHASKVLDEAGIEYDIERNEIDYVPGWCASQHLLPGYCAYVSGECLGDAYSDYDSAFDAVVAYALIQIEDDCANGDLDAAHLLDTLLAGAR